MELWSLVRWVVAGIIVWYALKIGLQWLASQGWLFASPEKGRIIALKLGGRLIGYFGNLFDEKKVFYDLETGEPLFDGVPQHQHADRLTGNIEPGQDTELQDSFWWHYFGVIWTGPGVSLYEYPFLKEDGKLVMASSIFLKNPRKIVMKNVETLGEVRVDLEFLVKLQTENAGLALNYQDGWVGPVEEEIVSAIRGYVATKTPEEIRSEQTELDSKLFDLVVGLTRVKKDDATGKIINPSMAKQVGISISDCSMPGFGYAADFRAAMEAEARAKKDRLAEEEKSKARAKDIQILADAELHAAEQRAKGIKAIGDANNLVLQGMAKHVTKQGAVDIEKARASRDGMAGFKGKVLSLAGPVPVIMGDEKESIQKEKPAPKAKSK